MKPKKPKKISRGGLPVRISKRVQLKDGKEYPTWQVFWREEGKPRSTTRATQEEAEGLAEEIALRLGKGEIRQRILAGSELAEYERALGLCQESGGSLLDAARLLKSTKRPPPKKTVDEVRAEFLFSKKTRSPRHYGSLSSDTKMLSDTFGEKQILDLHVSDLTTWLSDMKVQARTKRNRYTNNRTMFLWARKMGYLPDATTEIERLDEALWAEVSRENWEDDYEIDDICLLTPLQLRKLFNAIPERLIPCLALGAFAGIRRSEALRLHWRMVKVKHIEVPRRIARKKNTRRLALYSEACAAWLEPCRQKEGLIIPRADRFNQLTDTAKTIGIDPWPENVLRHSFISYRLALIKNAAQVAYEAGTSVDKIASNYDEKATPEDAEKWFAIIPPKKRK